MPLATIEERLPHTDAFVYGSVDQPLSERGYHSYHVAPSSFLTEDSIDEYNANASRRWGSAGKTAGLVLAMALTLLGVASTEHHSRETKAESSLYHHRKSPNYYDTENRLATRDADFGKNRQSEYNNYHV